MNSSDPLKTAQDLAVTAQTLAVVALVTLTMAIIGKGGFAIANNLFADEITWRESIHNIGVTLIQLVPALLFFEATNKLRKALSTFSQGEFFSQNAAHHVAEAGITAIYAMVAVMVITPNLLAWVDKQGGFIVVIEPEYLGMLAFALFVCLVGKILVVATALKSENDAFV
jgi:hypothetical protein